MEDCGYMARVALVMDRSMSKIGLNGKAFLPLVTSFGCAVPGIMATRTIENTRDRLVTILIAPLMSCSARLPVYTLLIGAFVPGTRYLSGWVTLQGLCFLAMYAVGVAVAIPVAWLMKRFFFPSRPSPFVIELPPYSLPSWRVVLHRVWEQIWSFITRAGTLILATSVLLWATAYFPGIMVAKSSLLGKSNRIQRRSTLTKPSSMRNVVDSSRIATSVDLAKLASRCFMPSVGIGRLESVLSLHSRSRSHYCHVGNDLFIGRRRRREQRRSAIAVKIRAMARRSTGIQCRHGCLDHGLLCLVRSMRRDVNDHSAGNPDLALADLHLRLYDRVGIFRSVVGFCRRDENCSLLIEWFFRRTQPRSHAPRKQDVRRCATLNTGPKLQAGHASHATNNSDHTQTELGELKRTVATDLNPFSDSDLAKEAHPIQRLQKRRHFPLC